MVFILFSSSYSFQNTLDLYEGIKESYIPRRLFNIIDKNLILNKNGSRKKAYLDKGIIKYIRIQRMVINHKIHFDLFPLSLIPNSILKLEDSTISFKNNKISLGKKRRYTTFEKWLMDEDLITNFESKIERIGSFENVLFYKSTNKHTPYLTAKGRKKHLEKRHFFLIFFK